MKFFKMKKSVALLATAAVVAIAAVGAYAYFTSTGSGSGTATVGTSTNVTIAGTVTPGTGGLVPGGPTADAAFAITNPGGGNEYVNKLDLASVQAFASASDRTAGTPVLLQTVCDTSISGGTPAFSMPQVDVSFNIPGGVTHNPLAHGTITYHDTTVSQDGCQGKFLKFNFTTN